MRTKSNEQIFEEKNACIIHLKDHGHKLYDLNNKNQIPYLRAISYNKEAIVMMEKLFDIKESIEKMIKNTN